MASDYVQSILERVKKGELSPDEANLLLGAKGKITGQAEPPRKKGHGVRTALIALLIFGGGGGFLGYTLYQSSNSNNNIQPQQNYIDNEQSQDNAYKQLIFRQENKETIVNIENTPTAHKILSKMIHGGFNSGGKFVIYHNGGCSCFKYNNKKIEIIASYIDTMYLISKSETISNRWSSFDKVPLLGRVNGEDGFYFNKDITFYLKENVREQRQRIEEPQIVQKERYEENKEGQQTQQQAQQEEQQVVTNSKYNSNSFGNVREWVNCGDLEVMVSDYRLEKKRVSRSLGGYIGWELYTDTHIKNISDANLEFDLSNFSLSLPNEEGIDKQGGVVNIPPQAIIDRTFSFNVTNFTGCYVKLAGNKLQRSGTGVQRYDTKMSINLLELGNVNMEQ